MTGDHFAGCSEYTRMKDQEYYENYTKCIRKYLFIKLVRRIRRSFGILLQDEAWRKEVEIE